MSRIIVTALAYRNNKVHANHPSGALMVRRKLGAAARPPSRITPRPTDSVGAY